MFRNSGLGVVAFTFVIQMLLLCAGIHPNPGPGLTDDHRDISICHINIRSLKHIDKFGNRDKLLHIKCNLANQFKIITVSETWLTRGDSSNDFVLPGYQKPFRRDREAHIGTEGYGGVLAWVSNAIACKRRADIEPPNSEAMWLEVRSQNKKFFLCVAYRAPTNKHNFWDEMQTSVNMIKEINKSKIIITGDLNADPGTPEGIKMKQFVEANDFIVHIKESTRITENSQTILDQFISNIPNMVKSVSVFPPVSTNDHCTITMELNFRTPKALSYKRTMWDFKKANFDQFREALASCDWQECFTDVEDIDTATELWTTKLLTVAKEMIPNKEVTIRPNDKPWYTNILRQLCRKKDRLFKKAKQINSPESWEKYKRIRNQYFNEISDAKKLYDSNKYQMLVDEKNSSKKWWSLLKQVQKSNDVIETIPAIHTGGDILTDSKDKAEAFNVFFQKASMLDESNAILPDERILFQHGLEALNITLQDVIDQINILDTTKSYGPDQISPKFIKEGGLPIAESLCTLFNMSLRLSKFPKQWKKANIVPIHKKDEKNELKNYRPVSLLSVVGKIMERIVFKYVYNFYKDNFVISVNQSGFLPGRSTVTQLLEVHHEFCKAVDGGKEIRVIFLDISKAFDRVWHTGLLYKLKKSGIHGGLLDWFKNYLTDRLQRVVINGQLSEWLKILAGVPQGSVLGPLLFLIYIDDIIHTVENCKIRLFADDTCLFLEVDNRENAANLINGDLANIANWSNQWLVNFSPTKTKSLIISNKADAHLNPPVFLFNQAIEEVQSHMYLGLRFANNLRWKHHVNDIAQSARKKLNSMVPLKYKLDKKSLEIMYTSFVLPTMEYANIVWGGTYDCDVVKLENIQIDAIRLITGATARSNIVKLYEEVSFQSIQTRIDNASLSMMYKIVNGSAPIYLSNLVINEDVNRRYNLRQTKVLKEIQCRLETYSRSFFPRIIKLWNNLPTEVQSINSLHEFKHKFKPVISDLILLYYYGSRWPSVHHARMRIGCSNLKNDLCNNLHVIDSMQCDCGAPVENAHHYFLECPLFNDNRNSLINKIGYLTLINTNILLYGNAELTLEDNKRVFDAVHEFITKTKRFD